MGDSARLTRLHTGKRRLVQSGFAGVALILEFLCLVSGHKGDRLIPQGIVRVFIHHNKNIGRASCGTITTTVAKVRVNGDKKFTGGIFISVVCPHQHTLFDLS
jgi:hypothetical protein